MRKNFSLLTLLAILAVVSPRVEAKELQGRLGLGYNGQFSSSSATNGVPAISMKYGLTRDLHSAFVFGTNTSAPTNTVAALKFFKNIFFETNLNFYFLVAAGYVSAAGNSGVEFLTGFGAEFFIPGLESLGFSTETGVAFGSATGSFALRSMGVSFLQAGIHFYF